MDAAAELLASRKSVNDLVRGELNSLMALSALSAADKARLQQHFDSIRDTEVKLNQMAWPARKTACPARRSKPTRPASPSRRTV